MNKRSFYRSVVYSILYLSQFILRSRKLNNCKPIVISNGSRFIVLGVFKYQSTGLQNYKSPDTGNYVSKFVMCKRLGDFFCWLLLYWLLSSIGFFRKQAREYSRRKGRKTVGQQLSWQPGYRCRKSNQTSKHHTTSNQKEFVRCLRSRWNAHDRFACPHLFFRKLFYL